MAECQAIRPTTPIGYTLTLTPQEADALLGLVGSVGMTSEFRTITDGIYDALRMVHVRSSWVLARGVDSNNFHPRDDQKEGQANGCK